MDTMQILDVNGSAVETYGYSREELLQMSFLDLGLARVARRIHTLEITSCSHVPKILYRTKDGTALTVNIRSCPAQQLGKDVLLPCISGISASPVEPG
jgi:PAS domain S-box-containing protein